MRDQTSHGTDVSSTKTIEHGAVDHSRVVELAHQKFLARGGAHGHDLDDWLEAETELRRSATAGHGSEHAPTALATQLEAERHDREADNGHFAAGVDGRLKARSSKPASGARSHS